MRTSYATYCHRQFSETHAKLTFDRSLVKEMARFSGWNFLGASAQVFSPQGITLLTNIFFGVAMNAARAVALQVDNIVKQFAINVIIAINPQITKSYVSGGRDYSYSLMCKACKYSVLIRVLPVLLLGAIPAALICRFMDDGVARLLVVLVASTAAIAVSTYAFAMTEGERGVIRSKLRKSRS